jgi:hypothetical protein
MVRRAEDYAKTVTGICGHVCTAWPQINDRKTGEPTVICDTCDDWVKVAPPGHMTGQISLLDDESF